MFGVLVNTVAVIVGSVIGLICKRGIPERLSGAVMTAIGLCTIAIGVVGLSSGENTLVLILSMVLGTLMGTLLDLDGRRWKRRRRKLPGRERPGRSHRALLQLACCFALAP